MKIALVYDRVNKFGGAEQILLALHGIWPEAPLYTSVYAPTRAVWANVFDVRTSFLQKLPISKHGHEYYPFMMGLAFETFNFDEFDVVISVTHEFAKAIITKPHTRHICICLTPTSYLWEPGYSQYFFHRRLFKMISRPIIRYLRWYDKIVSSRPDEYIAISETVQQRIKNIYGRESKVIYPPVDFKGDSLSKESPYQANSFYLIVSRLVPNKRVDIAIEAFNKLDLPLVVIGKGRELKSLRRQARSKGIRFAGYLTDEQVAAHYNACKAVIVCGEEDFNIVAVEAQAHGKPVIAFGRGGVTETVIKNQTGWFFLEQKAKSLVQLITTLEKGRLAGIDPKKCVENAKKFSKERFKQEIERYVRNH